LLDGVPWNQVLIDMDSLEGRSFIIRIPEPYRMPEKE
jgi:hypothetical protein